MSDARVPVLDTYQAVVSAFSDFLVVAIHTILYERNVYPRNSFLKARKYNFPVRQSRHPKVCKWIQDAVAAVEVEMLKVMIKTQLAHGASCVSNLTDSLEAVITCGGIAGTLSWIDVFLVLLRFHGDVTFIHIQH